MSKKPVVTTVFMEDDKEAAALGREVGMLVAGATVHLDLLSRVGPVFQMMSNSQHFDTFSRCFVDMMVSASKSGVEGALNRSEMTHHLRQVQGNICKEATDYAIEHHGKGNDKVVNRLDHLLEVAKSCGRAADALYAPMERNLEGLIEEGKRVVAIQKMQQQHELDRKLELLSSGCSNSNCNFHIKN